MGKLKGIRTYADIRQCVSYAGIKDRGDCDATRDLVSTRHGCVHQCR